MRNTIVSYSFALALGVAAIGCDGSANNAAESVELSSQALTGGDPATNADYPATVILGGCTAAKVGPRHFLLAAHCVNDDTAHVSGDFAPGSPISVIVSHPNDGTPPNLNLTVQQTYVHADWTNACVAPCPVNILSPGNPPDVALVVVQQDSPNLPAAWIDGRPLVDQDPVVVTGAGCESGLNGPGSPRRVKFEKTNVLTPQALTAHPMPQNEIDVLAAGYWLSPGQSLNSEEASLCFGDSGGPAYRDDPTQSLVVGVNAYYSFISSNGISYTNWHTRLDASSASHIADWLRGLGANVVQGDALGDVDGSGTVDNSDAVATARYSTGLTVRPFLVDHADVNCDGRIDSVDALRISQAVQGKFALGCKINSSLSVTSDWGTGYCATLQVVNQDSRATTNWAAKISTNQAVIYSTWNGSFSSNSGTAIVTPQAWNRVIGSGSTNATVGYCANRLMSFGQPRVLAVTATY